MSFDADAPGTPAEAWNAESRLHDRPSMELNGIDELLVVAAHPDDETLGAGGLLAACARRGISTRVIVVTDGGAGGIAERRAGELETAMRELGTTASVLGFADGRAREDRHAIRDALRPIIDDLARTALIAAPWRGDGHRDHRVVGEIVASLADGRRLLEYPIWLWHWGDPAAVEWDDFVALPIDVERKVAALEAYRSQREGDRPVLRADFLRNFVRDTELFAVSPSLGSAYFEGIHSRRDDPWGFDDRWYERRKRDITIASLTEPRYGRGLEIGCSIGVLTERLVERVDDLLAVDIAATAVRRARERVGSRARVEQTDVLDGLPGGPFDLVVLSEVGYYFGEQGLQRVLADIRRALAPDGVLVACHWRHQVADYPLTGDEVDAAVTGSGLAEVARHVERDFVLSVHRVDGRSVAERTGLA